MNGKLDTKQLGEQENKKKANRMCSLSSLQIILRGHVFDTILHRIFVEQLSNSKTLKNSMILTILLSCNFKGLVFYLIFYLNGKRN